MKKSFLFNISEQGGLPGGPNEVNNNIMGSISIDQQVYTSNNNLPVYMDLDDDEIEQYRKGGWVVEEYNTGGVIKHQGWEYKREGDAYLTRRQGDQSWITAKGQPLEAIKRVVYKETPAATNTTPYQSQEITEDEVKSLREYKPQSFSDNNYVVNLQTKLKKAGYDIGNFGTNKDGIDGIMGSRTKAALQAFNSGVSPADLKVQQEQVKKKQAPGGRHVGTTQSGYTTNKNVADGYLPTLTGTDPRAEETCKEGFQCSKNTSWKMGNLLGDMVEGGAGALYANNSWYNKDAQLKQGGIELYSTSERNMSKMPSVPKDLYSKLRVGDYVHLNRAGTTYDYEPEDKYKNEKVEHMGFIVGKDEDGVPLVWHASDKGKAFIQRIDGDINLYDHAIPGVTDGLSYKVASIVRNPAVNKLDITDLKKLENKSYYSPIDDNKKIIVKNATSSQSKAVEAVNNSQKIFKDMGYSQDEVLKAGQLLAGGIMGMESSGDTSLKRYGKQAAAYVVKDVLGQKKAFEGDQASWGVYQIKDDYNFKNEDGTPNRLGERLKMAGVDPDDIMDNVENQTIAGLVILLDNYDQLKRSENYNPKTDTYNHNGKQIPAGYILAKSWSAGSGWQNRDKYSKYLDEFDIDYSNEALSKASQALDIEGVPKHIRATNELYRVNRGIEEVNESKKRQTEYWEKLAREEEQRKKEDDAKFAQENPRAYYDLNFTNAAESTAVQPIRPISLIAPYSPRKTYAAHAGAPANKPIKTHMSSKLQEGGIIYKELTDAEIEQYRRGGWIIEEI